MNYKSGLPFCKICGKEVLQTKKYTRNFCNASCRALFTKNGISNKGKKRSQFSEEWKKNIGESRRGKKHSEETKIKMSESAKNREKRIFSEDARKNISKASIIRYKKFDHPMLNRHLSEETKNKISEKIRMENNGNWQGGKSFEEYGIEFNEQLREEIRKRDNYTCKNCDMTEEEHIIVFGLRLNVHHIDYNKRNNVKTNLLTSCVSCNSRFNFNRDYWKRSLTEKMEQICQIL
jgi:hypothetical protein